MDIVMSWAQETQWFGRKVIVRREGEAEWAKVAFRNKVRASSSTRIVSGYLTITVVHVSHPVVGTIPPLLALHALC